VRRALVLLAALLLSACEAELYNNLDQRQANEMVATLQQRGIPAQRVAVRGGQYTVVVDKDRFAESITILKDAGLPRQEFQTMGQVFKKDGLVSSPTQEQDGKAEATSLVTETALRVDRYLQSIEPQVAQLAMSVVHRVLGNFDTRDLVAAAAGQAIADLRREKRLTVTVHPDVVDRVSKEFARLGVSGRIEVTIEGNPSLDPSACIIASDLAVIDASIKTQLAAIATALGAV
jgi:type III secretion system YscJ/HrcJ family lipoprotein